MSSAMIFQAQSALILALMFYGASVARQRLKHVRIMGTAIIWDLLLILQIELTRSAIDKAMKIVENPMALKIHLFFAITTVLLYGVMIFTGRKVYKGQNQLRSFHKSMGITTLVFRVMTFATSFFAV